MDKNLLYGVIVIFLRIKISRLNIRNAKDVKDGIMVNVAFLINYAKDVIVEISIKRMFPSHKWLAN